MRRGFVVGLAPHHVVGMYGARTENGTVINIKRTGLAGHITVFEANAVIIVKGYDKIGYMYLILRL